MEKIKEVGPYAMVICGLATGWCAGEAIQYAVVNDLANVLIYFLMAVVLGVITGEWTRECKEWDVLEKYRGDGFLFERRDTAGGSGARHRRVRDL